MRTTSLFVFAAMLTLAAQPAAAADKAVQTRQTLEAQIASHKERLQRQRPTAGASFAVLEGGANMTLGAHGVVGLGKLRRADGRVVPSLLLGTGIGGGLGVHLNVGAREYDAVGSAKEVPVSGIYKPEDKGWKALSLGFSEGRGTRMSTDPARQTTVREGGPAVGIVYASNLVEGVVRIPLFPAVKSRWLKDVERINAADLLVQKGDLSGAEKLLAKVKGINP